MPWALTVASNPAVVTVRRNNLDSDRLIDSDKLIDSNTLIDSNQLIDTVEVIDTDHRPR